MASKYLNKISFELYNYLFFCWLLGFDGSAPCWRRGVGSQRLGCREDGRAFRALGVTRPASRASRGGGVVLRLDVWASLNLGCLKWGSGSGVLRLIWAESV